MSRRFQFGLRGLLANIAIGSILLGGWQIYVAHFATYVEAATTHVGQPIILRGRFSLEDGARSAKFQLAAIRPGITSTRSTECTDCWAERHRFGIYTFSGPAMCLNQSRWTQPGGFDLLVYLPDGRYIKGHVTVEP
jgi:hypothetical protein